MSKYHCVLSIKRMDGWVPGGYKVGSQLTIVIKDLTRVAHGSRLESSPPPSKTGRLVLLYSSLE